VNAWAGHFSLILEFKVYFEQQKDSDPNVTSHCLIGISFSSPALESKLKSYVPSSDATKIEGVYFEDDNILLKNLEDIEYQFYDNNIFTS